MITHGPPYGILDQAKKNVKFEHLGCGELLKALHRVKPIVSVFGHIHGGYGKFETNFGTTCYNASLVNEAYKLVNQPWVIEI